MTPLYSEIVKDHAISPRNRREMEPFDRSGESRYSRCGDKLKLYFRLQDQTIVDVSFTGSACGPAVAAASLTTTLLLGRTVTEARQLSAFELHEALGGLPTSKRHAILLVLDCLTQALGPRL
jgi:nitrogen fixation NifU-like protein